MLVTRHVMLCGDSCRCTDVRVPWCLEMWYLKICWCLKMLWYLDMWWSLQILWCLMMSGDVISEDLMESEQMWYMKMCWSLGRFWYLYIGDVVMLAMSENWRYYDIWTWCWRCYYVSQWLEVGYDICNWNWLSRSHLLSFTALQSSEPISTLKHTHTHAYNQ